MAQLLTQGVHCHQAGRLAEARGLYEQVLRVAPRQADALHLLGLVAHQTGDHRRGIELIRDALRRNERASGYHNSLGECWRALGEWEKAAACYRRALQLDPKSADALANLGTTLRAQGKPLEAVDRYAASLRLRPNDPRNLANLGGAYCEAGKTAEAIEASGAAVKLAPGMFEGWMNLGIALRVAGRNREAVPALERALALKPGEADVLTHLGLALSNLGRREEALRILQAAIAAQPNEPRAYLHVGNLWREVRRFDLADRCYAKVIELDPASAEAWNNLGLSAQEQGLFLTADRRFRRSLELDPKNTAAWTNLGVIWNRMGQSAKSLACYREALVHASVRDAAGSNAAYAMQFSSDVTPQEICAEARRWGDAVIAACPPRRAPAAGPRPGNGRVRVGYVSPDFRSHPISYFMAGLLSRHDRSRFEVYCYSAAVAEDEWTARIKGYAEHWRPVLGLSDDELAEMIRVDAIDVLIDLTGHTAKHRLRVFARKPARVQATYLGFPGTTGLTTIDYRITDRWADPAEATDGHYVEKLMLLDRCAWCYQPSEAAGPVAAPPSLGQGGRITFGCYNNYAKVSDAVLRAWAQLLRAAGEARLLLKGDVFNETEFGDVTRARLREFGIDPARVAFEPRTKTLAEHFARYHAVDIALDTFPYHGTTTTCDALWMGVPVVTWCGDRHASRVGASLLHAVGLDDLIAVNAEDYVAKALALSRDPGRLAAVRSGLRERMAGSALCDPKGFARAFEAVIGKMLQATPGETDTVNMIGSENSP